MFILGGLSPTHHRPLRWLTRRAACWIPHSSSRLFTHTQAKNGGRALSLLAGLSPLPLSWSSSVAVILSIQSRIGPSVHRVVVLCVCSGVSHVTLSLSAPNPLPSYLAPRSSSSDEGLRPHTKPPPTPLPPCNTRLMLARPCIPALLHAQADASSLVSHSRGERLLKMCSLYVQTPRRRAASSPPTTSSSPLPPPPLLPALFVQHGPSSRLPISTTALRLFYSLGWWLLLLLERPSVCLNLWKSRRSSSSARTDLAVEEADSPPPPSSEEGGVPGGRPWERPPPCQDRQADEKRACETVR